eukprot:scaffold427333_cov55-Prasinocladus_malaysianus.AAC.1
MKTHSPETGVVLLPSSYGEELARLIAEQLKREIATGSYTVKCPAYGQTTKSLSTQVLGVHFSRQDKQGHAVGQCF